MYCQNVSHNYSTGGKEGVTPLQAPSHLVGMGRNAVGMNVQSALRGYLKCVLKILTEFQTFRHVQNMRVAFEVDKRTKAVRRVIQLHSKNSNSILTGF